MLVRPQDVMKLMNRLGVKMEEIDVEKVIIKLSGGKTLIFNNPKVIRTESPAGEVFQVAGTYVTEEEYTPSEEDIKIVIEKTGKSREEVVRILREVKGDIAEAIIRLSSQ